MSIRGFLPRGNPEGLLQDEADGELDRARGGIHAVVMLITRYASPASSYM